MIELSIVLVIIGLIVGGVLVGQDLIRAAAERAQITQIEKYNTAVNTFRGKYNALPGDMDAQTAASFGFAARGSNPGQGDGNGILQGYYAGSGMYTGVNSGTYINEGEPAMFWSDLTYANGMNINLIAGSFSTASSTMSLYTGGYPTPDGVALYLPPAKIDNVSYVYAYSANSINYFGLSAVTHIGSGNVTSSPNLTVRSAYNIDAKIDDGFPMSGTVTAVYSDNSFGGAGGLGYGWAGSGGVAGNTPYTTMTPPSTATCFDNGNVPSAAQRYSLAQNNGTGANCALSFKFQ